MSTTEVARLTPLEEFGVSLKRKAEKYDAALPPDCGLTANMVISSVVAYATKNPDVLSWDRPSVMACVYEGLQLGLMADGGVPGYYLVPFNKKAVLVVDYKAEIDLAVRSGTLASVTCHAVYSNDHFEMEVIDGRARLMHKWDLDAPLANRGRLRGVYATGMLPDGNPAQPRWMNVAELEAFKQKYVKRIERNLLWGGDETDKMHAYRKTVLRAFLQLIPKSATRLSNALGMVSAVEAKTLAHAMEGTPDIVDVDAKVSCGEKRGAARAQEQLGMEGDDSPAVDGEESVQETPQAGGLFEPAPLDDPSYGTALGNALLYSMPFGKHKGTTLGTLLDEKDGLNYLSWIVTGCKQASDELKMHARVICCHPDNVNDANRYAAKA